MAATSNPTAVQNKRIVYCGKTLDKSVFINRASYKKAKIDFFRSILLSQRYESFELRVMYFSVTGNIVMLTNRTFDDEHYLARNNYP